MTMAVVLDHLFICTLPGAPEAEQLVALGLTEASNSIHQGQGTSSRRFFLRNAMIECLWVHDEQEARSALIRPTHLWERWRYRGTGASPFGIALRPDASEASPAPAAPFESWAYKPPYLPEPWSFAIGQNASVIEEPLCFYMPFGRRPDTVAPEHRHPLEHPLRCQELTALRLTLPHTLPVSPVLHTLAQLGIASFNRGPEHLAEVVLDEGAQGQRVDFQPALPLIMCY
jgi:hypothetical protein